MTEETAPQRVLLIAPTIDSEDVGEAWVAYQWARHLATKHDLTVLTYHKLGARPASEQLPGVRVVEWTEPHGLGHFERFNSILKPAYVPFYVRARRWIRQALRDGEQFDVAHQPVPVAMRYPSPVAGLGIPLVMGPVGGGLDSPPAFQDDEGSTPWFMRLRALDAWRLRHDRLLAPHLPGRRLRARHRVVRLRPAPGRRRPALRNLERDRAHRATGAGSCGTDGAPGDTLRLLHVGRLVRTKGLRDVLRALSLLPDVDLRLDVVGEGPERVACEALVRDLGLSDRVMLHGWQDRDSVAAHYRAADVFVFPSYREPGGNVVFEAMGHGLPLIVCDRGGPGAAADQSCAEILPVSTPDALAKDVAAAIRRLAADPERRRAMGSASRRRAAATALWPAKVATVGVLYEELGRRSRTRSRPVADVLVVVTTHNSSHVVGDLLDSLPAALDGPQAEIVVVDNASTDEHAGRRGPARRLPRWCSAPNRGYSGRHQPRRCGVPGERSWSSTPTWDRARLGRALLARCAAGHRDRRSAHARRPRATSSVAAARAHPEPRLGLAYGRPALSEYVTDEAPTRPAAVGLGGRRRTAGRPRCHEAGRRWDESLLPLLRGDRLLPARARPWLGDGLRARRRRAIHIGGSPGRSDRIHAMQIVNRVRLFYAGATARRAAALYWLLTMISEATWVLRGHPQSRAALRALVRPATRAPELGCSSSLVPR